MMSASPSEQTAGLVSQSGRSMPHLAPPSVDIMAAPPPPQPESHPVATEVAPPPPGSQPVATDKATGDATCAAPNPAAESRPVDLPTAPPQPPLPPSDPPFALPEIVHGIEPQAEALSRLASLPLPPSASSSSPDARPREDPQHSAPALLQPGAVSEVFSSLSARVQRVVRLARPPEETPPDRDAPPALFLFGDSITALSVTVSAPDASPGWAALLREAYGDSVEVFVRGHSGYNSAWALHILPRLLRTSLRAGANIRAATIFFGANDACEASAEMHVPLDDYARNLEKMVCFVRELGITPVLITPPALGSSRDDADSPRAPERTAKYAEACVAVAHRTACPVIDLVSAMTSSAGDSGVDGFLNDGLHLSPSGNRMVFDLLVEVFTDVLPDLVPGALLPGLPSWSEIDPKDPAAALGTSELTD